eukprot:6756336-Pyramimonas_sp.AAC.1
MQSMWCNRGGALHVVQSTWRKGMPSDAKQRNTTSSNSVQYKPMRSNAKPFETMQGNGKQCEAVQS